jgi:hypothetical protein
MATTAYNSHPLPPPPQQLGQNQQSYQAPPPQQYQAQQSQPPQHPQQRQQAPPHIRTKSRGFSFRSDKSHDSGPKSPRFDLVETSAEKDSRRIHGKADPTLAMNEAEPAAVAQMSSSEAFSKPLRSIQHKDGSGNPIADPDRSNPTRSRWERPLDTIRSFEAAIDGDYRRKSFYRSDSETVSNWSRRASYYGNHTPRFPQDNYYSGRPNSTMYDVNRSMGAPRDGFHEGNYDGRNRYSRMQSDPHTMSRQMGDRNVYPIANNHRSYETVASGSGSGSYGEPAGYQTDPTSSENSSVGRRSPPKRQQPPMNDYGISFGQTGANQSANIGTAGANGSNTAGPPPLSKKEGGSLLRKASKVGTPSNGAQERPGMGEKRKSWFARRFSRQ